MLPIVHPGVAYLLYRAGTAVTGRGPPSAHATVALVMGAVVPDLVDQPLYYLGELPSTRALGHSLLVAIPVCLLLIGAASRGVLSRDSAAGFIIGYLSHPFADALWPFLLGPWSELGFLLWPLTASPPYDGQRLLLTVGAIPIHTIWIELAILAVALVVWWRDGRPGLSTDRVTRFRQRIQ